MFSSSRIKCAFFLFILIVVSGNLIGQCDPYSWAREGQGGERDEGHGVAVDPFGNVFYGGWFDSDSLILDGGATANSSLGQNGNGDVFIARYRPDGSLSWVTSAGGIDNSDWCWDIAAGPDGSVFGTGEFYSSTMDFGSGVTISKSGLSDAWVAKWDSTGTIVWARAFGAADSDQAFGVTSDSAGNCYITGAFGQTIVHGSTTIVENAGDDLFVAKYDPAGTPLWAASTGGTSYDGGQEIAVGADGSIYVAGRSFGDMNFGGTSWTNMGLGDMFLLSFTPTGAEDWMFVTGGVDGDEARDVAVHPDGSIILVGSYWSSPLNFAGTNLTANGQWDAFVSRFNPDGSLQWVRAEGSTGSDHIYGVAVAADGTIYTGGQWGGGSTTFDGITLDEVGMFNAVWSDAGTALSAEAFGGTLTQFDVIWAAAAGAAGGFYAGEFTSASVDFGGGVSIDNGPTGTFDSDVFVVAQRSPAGLSIAEPLEGDTICEGQPFELNLSSAGLNVQWYFNGLELPGETGNSLLLPGVSAGDAGLYYAILNDGCDAASSDSAWLEVIVFPGSPILTTSSSNDTIFASHTGQSLVWLVDGVIEPGLTGDTIIPVIAGEYTAVSLNSSGGMNCASPPSDAVQIDFQTGLNVLDRVLRIYPNPLTSSELYIELPVAGIRNWNLNDLSGRNIALGQVSFMEGKASLYLNLRAGFYYLDIEGAAPVKLCVY